ncbi:MAG: helix-turn-helix transcriptional regulator [Planctomycetes bacterium]|nr:helix-turn-helix transcriptional regulator [Planctomycetota bacterium]
MGRRNTTISQVLREAITKSGESLADLERTTGVSNAVLSRFVRGERTLTLPTADKLARHFGLELVKRERRRT